MYVTGARTRGAGVFGIFNLQSDRNHRNFNTVLFFLTSFVAPHAISQFHAVDTTINTSHTIIYSGTPL